VKRPISTALRSVFEAQNPRPICMMCSGVGFSPTCDLPVRFRFLEQQSFSGFFGETKNIPDEDGQTIAQQTGGRIVYMETISI
jgi:hypothetical protein